MDLPEPERHLLRGRDLADTRYADPIDVAAMLRPRASRERISARSFSHAFGESPGAYLLTRRQAGSLFLSSDDIHADYEALTARGIEFYEEPTEYPYGTDSGSHDPSGNAIRLAQVKPEFNSTRQTIGA